MPFKKGTNNPNWKGVNKDTVIKLYTKEKKPITEIAKIFGVTKGCIWSYLKRNNISRRKLKDVLKGQHHSPKTEFKKGNKKWLGIKGKIHPAFGNNTSRNKGYKHPLWKGGITPKSTKLRNSDRYKQWREAVYKRDNYTCQDCGDNQGGNLNAHHEIPFAECLEIGFEEMIFNVDNGTTYCEPCHWIKEGEKYA